MIRITEYKNRDEALEKILKMDKDYTIIRHDFPKGEFIEPHKHPVDEWVIFDYGKCEAALGLESRVIEAKNKTMAIYFPRNIDHSLKCLTDISYWVLRSTE